MSRMVLIVVALAGISQVQTGPAPLAGTPMPDPQAGRMSQARVFITNKDPKTDAIPVALVGVEPARVVLTGSPSVAVTGTVTAVTQSAVQRWEYRTVMTGSASADPTSALNSAGNDGWELAGVIPGSDGRATLVLKRPR